jgi:hypothetical protein
MTTMVRSDSTRIGSLSSRYTRSSGATTELVARSQRRSWNQRP